MKKIFLLLVLGLISINLYAQKTIMLKSSGVFNKHDVCYYNYEIRMDTKGRITYLEYSNYNERIEINYDDEITWTTYREGEKYNSKNNFLTDCTIVDTGKNLKIETDRGLWYLENGVFLLYDKHCQRLDGYCLYYKTKDGYITTHKDELIHAGNSTNVSNSLIASLKSNDKKINEINAKILFSYELVAYIPFLLSEEKYLGTTIKSYNASSELKEKKAHYKAENLRHIDGLPWASANGYGINDTITINLMIPCLKGFIFYNGFQSTSNKDLYKANSRVKKLRIKYLPNNQYIDVELADTPKKQIIMLDKLYYDSDFYENFEFTILEVYPGEKYKDLCIQSIQALY